MLAPISGEVVERLVSPGQVMGAGQTQAFTISDLSTVWVLANVYEADLAFVHSGEPVSVQTDAYPSGTPRVWANSVSTGPTTQSRA